MAYLKQLLLEIFQGSDEPIMLKLMTRKNNNDNGVEYCGLNSNEFGIPFYKYFSYNS